ncbi:hypothetical protein L6R49_04155 [Myxococcota bacterium]|nr:hypothetical protein [Myxococcota bacterium]
MPSITATQYRSSVAALLRHMMLRPRMYFLVVRDVAHIMGGHAAAFYEFGLLREVKDVNQDFTDWINERYKLPRGGEGWPPRLRVVAQRQGRDPQALLFECLVEFLAEWAPLPEPTLAARPTDSPKVHELALMPSITASKYRSSVAALLRSMMPRPRMYFFVVEDVQFILIGHAIAFHELGLPWEVKDVNQDFTDWINERYKLPRGGEGWPPRLLEVAQRQGRDPQALLFECLVEFLAEWAPRPEPTAAAPPTESSEP